ncbi:hypothetical protein FB567DRAFT_594694 [Paraphoma chrysanthemicola]|uniref:Uncharacterized protein n=1 Tax=Paraphoma chrysanthemicola TaxID=798071 RepID=A0A8K0R1E6_9PLEO|nr:hypothetical protein FB567DRAFT_594694 [Paraphoma chrysanthemicola]
MDAGPVEPIAACVKPNIESTHLLEFKSRGRYQAYCATEASSRPVSPDTLTLNYLHAQPSSLSPRIVEPESDRQNETAQPSRSNIEYDKDVATFSKWTMQNSVLQFPANDSVGSRHSMLGNSNHITQAVTPRGSHPLAVSQTLACNRTPSHPRMQSPRLAENSASESFRPEPPPHHIDKAFLDRHPLPPLPAELLEEDSVVELEALPLDHYISDDNLQKSAKSVLPGPTCAAKDALHKQCGPPTYGNSDVSLICNTGRTDASTLPGPLKQSATSKENSRYCSKRKVYDDAFSRGMISDSGRSRLIDEKTQFPSSIELYTPRGLFSDDEDNRRAPRRTQPRDVKLRYQFGQRPLAQLTVAPSVSPHRYLFGTPPGVTSSENNEQTDDHDYMSLKNTAASFDGSVETQPGPRPPPWGSYDNLEMQRRNRGDLREREDTRKYRMAVRGGSFVSLNKISGSEGSFSNNPLKREVEEYREQVLHLYPDLDFDGTASNGGRRCCLACVVM